MQTALYIFLILAMLPLLGWTECLSWQPPTESFDGAALSRKVESYDIYVGSSQNFQDMSKVGTQIASADETPDTVYFFGAYCNSIGLQPHNWACVTATYPEGTSECALVERNPPGQSKKLRVEGF